MLLSAKMEVFRTNFVTEIVEKLSRSCREREREGEAQNTILHDNFSIFIKNLKMCLKDDILASTQWLKRFEVFRTNFLTGTVEKGRERERLKTLPYTIYFQFSFKTIFKFA